MSYERKASRRQQYRAFDLFTDRATGWFIELAAKDEKHEFHSNEYAFHILRGGRAGGVDNRIFEVFYGSRPFDLVTTTQYSEQATNRGLPGLRRHFLSEHGVTLLYTRLDDGGVSCMLYPAGSDNFHRIEDGILLRVYRDARTLTGIDALSQDWRCFASYREVTSLDGQPSIADSLRVYWLLFTRRTTVNGTLQERRLFAAIGWILKYALTMALSGAVFVKLLEIFGVIPNVG